MSLTDKFASDMERYNAENIPMLEEHVWQQCRTGTYDLDANLTLLKLYQFFPDAINIDFVFKVLLKALTHLPHNDFTLSLCLLNDHILQNDIISKILVCSQLLESGNFPQFWKDVQHLSAITQSIHLFENAIRRYIAHVVTITYQTISDARLCELLGLQTQQMQEFINTLGWKIENHTITVPLNENNQAKTAVYQDGVKFEQIAKLLNHVA